MAETIKDGENTSDISPAQMAAILASVGELDEPLPNGNETPYIITEVEKDVNDDGVMHPGRQVAYPDGRVLFTVKPDWTDEQIAVCYAIAVNFQSFGIDLGVTRAQSDMRASMGLRDVPKAPDSSDGEQLELDI